jgi:hypothetical protein
MMQAEGRIRLESASQVRLQDLLPVTNHPPDKLDPLPLKRLLKTGMDAPADHHRNPFRR